MKVCIADDDKFNRVALKKMLSNWGFDVVTAGNGAEAWEIMQDDESPRLVILDWVMPEIDGVEVCRRIRQKFQSDNDYRFIILLTAQGSKADIVEGLTAGADDYVTKPFDPHELQMRIRAGKRIIELQEKLRFNAMHDPLTGILNRGAVLERLYSELARSRRENQPMTLAMLDLDHFKVVNDTHGHLAGDEVLRETTRRIKNIVRDYDIVGRYGGEEFLIVIPGADRESALTVYERIREGIGARAMDTTVASLVVTASMGVAEYDGIMSDQELIQLADDALYRAKDQGRNRVVCAVQDAGRTP
ncbi:MAG TPA: diguanylate cyclase [Desulfomicrobiaceae bacterium]|nr:diguanylate cyclase [Desulfomicrobiaceae bacterium]